MLRAAILFFVLAIISAVLGFGGFAADFAWLAETAFVVFLVIAVVSFVVGRRGA